jgi:hypothetical protein
MAHKFAVSNSGAVETLAGTRTITAAEVLASSVFTLDPGGAGRSVVLPDAATAGMAGQFVVIANAADAAEVLTVSADSATVVTPTQAETAFLVCTGVKWYGVAGANS